MRTLPIKIYLDWLQAENYKAFQLSLLRVGLCIWLLKEVAINWGSHDILYGAANFVVYKTTTFSSLPGSIEFMRGHYQWFFGGYILVILLFMGGIGRWFTAVLLFALVFLLEQMNKPVMTGGDVMARLVLMYLIFADSYRFFVLYKSTPDPENQQKLGNLLSNLAAFSIMLQLCLAYLASGIGKINTEMWRSGEALYYALNMERYVGTSFNQYLFKYPGLLVAGNYAVLAFELLFPFLVWIRWLRKPMLIIGIIFHLCIYAFMMIYGFQLVFIMIYVLFLEIKPPKAWVQPAVGRASS